MYIYYFNNKQRVICRLDENDGSISFGILGNTLIDFLNKQVNKSYFYKNLNYNTEKPKIIDIAEKVLDYEYKNGIYSDYAPISRLYLLCKDFSISLKQKVFIPKKFETVYNGYVFDTLEEALMCEIYHMALTGLLIKRCDNCGRYFIFNPNQPAKYCQYSYDDKRLSCQQIGAQRKYKQNLHPIRECYNKARNRRFNQMPSKKSGLRTADIENKYKLWQIDNTEKMKEYIEKYDSESDLLTKSKIVEEFKVYLDSTIN